MSCCWAMRCALRTSDRLGHTLGDGGFRRLVQGLQGSRVEGRQRRAGVVSARAPATDEEDLEAANASLRWYEDMDGLVKALRPVEFARTVT